MNFTFDIGVPEMYDLTITLTAQKNSMSRSRSQLHDPLGLLPMDVVSDENGVVYVELPVGEWSVSDNSDEDYILIEEIKVEVQFDIGLPTRLRFGSTDPLTLRTLLDSRTMSGLHSLQKKNVRERKFSPSYLPWQRIRVHDGHRSIR